MSRLPIRIVLRFLRHFFIRRIFPKGVCWIKLWIVELSIKLPESLSKVGVGHPYRVRLLQGNLLITCLIAFRETVRLSGEVMGLGIDPRSGLSYR